MKHEEAESVDVSAAGTTDHAVGADGGGGNGTGHRKEGHRTPSDEIVFLGLVAFSQVNAEQEHPQNVSQDDHGVQNGLMAGPSLSENEWGFAVA